MASSLVSTKSLTTWNLELIGGLMVNDGWLVPNSCNDKYLLILVGVGVGAEIGNFLNLEISMLNLPVVLTICFIQSVKRSKFPVVSRINNHWE